MAGSIIDFALEGTGSRSAAGTPEYRLAVSRIERVVLRETASGGLGFPTKRRFHNDARPKQEKKKGEVLFNLQVDQIDATAN